jgi:hypothetical protein
MSKILLTITLLAIINVCFSTVCKDGSQCDGTCTCCLTSRGVGCCPYENANCCGDGLHCCPNGFTCDVSGGRCVGGKSNEFLAFLEMTPAKLEESKQVPTLPIVGSVNPADVLKCIYDLRPVVSDVIDIVKLIKAGDKQAVEKELLKLAVDGVALGEACWKLIK